MSEQEINKVDNPEVKETAKDLRTRFEENLAKSKQEIADERAKREKLEKQLADIKKAEEDKNKTLEEKLLAREQELQEQRNKEKKLQSKYTLEKSLLSSNVNPEFVELMLDKGSTQISEDLSNIKEVVNELKTQFPSAFIEKTDTPKPIGKVGVSANQGSQVGISKEEAIRMLEDPNQPITKELREAISVHKL